MSTMKWFSRFAIAALSCVLVKAQTATTNYIVGYWEGSGTPNVSHLTHLNYAFASIVTGSAGLHLPAHRQLCFFDFAVQIIQGQ